MLLELLSTHINNGPSIFQPAHRFSLGTLGSSSAVVRLMLKVFELKVLSCTITSPYKRTRAMRC